MKFLLCGCMLQNILLRIFFIALCLLYYMGLMLHCRVATVLCVNESNNLLWLSYTVGWNGCMLEYVSGHCYNTHYFIKLDQLCNDLMLRFVFSVFMVFMLILCKFCTAVSQHVLFSHFAWHDFLCCNFTEHFGAVQCALRVCKPAHLRW